MQNHHSPASPRTDMPPPPGGIPTGQIKVLLVDDWHAFEDPRRSSCESGTRSRVCADAASAGA